MIVNPIDIQKAHPVRKSRKQKNAFRKDVCLYLQELGYECTIEKGSCGSRNVVVGNPESAEHLVCAHYDTCARMPVPNLITPCNFWLFIAYQILLTLVLLLPAVLLAVCVSLIPPIAEMSQLVFLVTILLTVFLISYGPANPHNANDNTSGVVTLLEIAKTMPENYRSRVCFVLFDMEEQGLFGSDAHRSAHKKAIKNQLVWNLDCVGEGDEILLFPSGKVKRDEEKMKYLLKCETKLATKSIRVCQKGFHFYPSDQMNFPYGVGIAALKRGKLGLYLDRIHTSSDTCLDETNVNILRAAITSAITCDGVR